MADIGQNLEARDAPRRPIPTTIRAEHLEANTCTGAGITARSTSPVLALCRQLLAAGLDPDQAMEVFRGATLALRIRAIGEAAGLEINSEGTGFRPARPPDAALPRRFDQKNGPSSPEEEAGTLGGEP
jgi:hypothetical protein